MTRIASAAACLANSVSCALFLAGCASDLASVNRLYASGKVVSLCRQSVPNASYAALDRLVDARTIVDKLRDLQKPPGGVFAQMNGNILAWAIDMATMLEKVGLRA